MQTPEFIKLAGADAEGAIASNPGLTLDSMPGGKAFKEKFTERFGPIQNYAPYAYDAVYVMVEAMKRANELIRACVKQDHRLHFIDIFHPMLGEDGKPRAELFEQDGLHLNAQGYALWAKIVRPHL